MRSLRILLLSTIVLVGSVYPVLAQDYEPLSKEYKQATIERLSQLMNDFYVFPDVAKETETHLMELWDSGHFDDIEDNGAFAAALTEAVQSVNNDKHMRIRENPPYEAPDNSPERMIEEQIHEVERWRAGNAGFQTVKLLEGNIGYIDIRGFPGMESGKAMADAYMHLIERCDAVIVDLTRNGGGSPRMVQYLCSYFFDEEVHLNSLYWREGDRTDEFWTVDVDGMKRPDVPLFIMTSDYTFSGAEEFSYNMQTQERATLVGETTGGGANPGGGRMLNENLTVFIPTGMAINPITGTNWEGVGVVPEVKTDPDSCFAVTHRMAMEAAEAYRAERRALYTEKLGALAEELNSYEEGHSEEAILGLLSDCVDHHIYEEWEINILGYDQLMQMEKPRIAQCIFRANTILFPESANTYDSYGESLVVTGDLEEAAESYQKAVELAIIYGDPNADLFKRNLDRVLEMMEERE